MDDLQRFQRVELILSDVDGVLTDGRITFDNRGGESKSFHARDGLGIRLWQRAGHHFGLITSRESPIVNRRARELDIQIVQQGCDNKLAAMDAILTDLQLTREQACYLGDDLLDLPTVRSAGLGVAVADACQELRQAADFITDTPGGHGAVRETIQRILQAQQRWDEVVRPYMEAQL